MDKKNKKIIILAIVFAVGFGIGAMLVVASSYAAETKKTFDAKKAYNYYCVQCHGLKGNGLGVNTPYMNVRPRDHTSAKDMNHLSNKQLFKAIKGGGLSVSKSVEMPPWGYTFTDQEIKALVYYLRELCQCKGR